MNLDQDEIQIKVSLTIHEPGVTSIYAAAHYADQYLNQLADVVQAITGIEHPLIIRDDEGRIVMGYVRDPLTGIRDADESTQFADRFRNVENALIETIIQAAQLRGSINALLKATGLNEGVLAAFAPQNGAAIQAMVRNTVTNPLRRAVADCGPTIASSPAPLIALIAAMNGEIAQQWQPIPLDFVAEMEGIAVWYRPVGINTV